MIDKKMIKRMNKKMITEKCKVCGADNMAYMFTANNCIISKCGKCSFVQVVDEKNIPPYNYNKSYFDNSKYKDKKALEKEHIRRKNLLVKYLGEEGRVLDAGCATGEFVKFVSDMYEVWGCDVSNEAIEIAKKRICPQLENRFICGTVENIILDNRRYDAICLWDVIEHISDPYEAFKGIDEKLEQDGYVFISTPNIGALFPKIMKNKWPFMTPPEHLCFFTRKSFEYFLSSFNMEIVEWSSRGKWANVGFILYKFNRVSKFKIPSSIIWLFQNTFLSKCNIYVPTGDIQYLVVKKKTRV